MIADPLERRSGTFRAATGHASARAPVPPAESSVRCWVNGHTITHSPPERVRVTEHLTSVEYKRARVHVADANGGDVRLGVRRCWVLDRVPHRTARPNASNL